VYLPILIASLALFQLKHYIFDYLLQTKYQLRNKGTYGHPGGLLHAGLHAAGSVPAIWIMRPEPLFIGLLIGGEFVIHYHVDWLKEQVLRASGWTHKDYGYWQAFGIDQMLHQLTYVGMAALLLSLVHFSL
jgi:hypothetical protein